MLPSPKHHLRYSSPSNDEYFTPNQTNHLSSLPSTISHHTLTNQQPHQQPKKAYQCYDQYYHGVANYNPPNGIKVLPPQTTQFNHLNVQPQHERPPSQYNNSSQSNIPQQSTLNSCQSNNYGMLRKDPCERRMKIFPKERSVDTAFNRPQSILLTNQFNTPNK